MEPSRVETFSDAVFAFAITLIVLSIEVPKTFTELFELMRGALGFAACFLVLYSVWNTQNNFFRRFGINDHFTTWLNGLLLFTILVYVYPLKFLAVLMFSGDMYYDHGVLTPRMMTSQQSSLLVIYGLGYSVIYFIFFLLYRHAQSHRAKLDLTDLEYYITETHTWKYFFNGLIGVLSMITAWLLPDKYAGLAGFVYFLIPVSYTWWLSYRGKRARLMAAHD